MKRVLGVFAMLAVGCYAGIDSGEIEQRQFEETDEIIDNLKEAGFPDEEIDVLEDGTVYVGMDAVVTLEASREMVNTSNFRQYSTNNLVDTSTYSTICINGSDFTNNTLDTALDQAITRYNALGLSFTLVRDDTGSNAICDFTIDALQMGGGGGVAGFPSGGAPYYEFSIGQNTGNTTITRHVIMHEIGHCVGFRHTDYFNRSISCGTGGNEGSAGVGANHIPGTPTGAVYLGSVMNSCYSSEVSGEWDPDDETALNYLYGGGGGGDGGGGDGGGGDGGGGDGGGGDDGPTCAPKGSSCTSASDCCSNKCKGKSGSKTCK